MGINGQNNNDWVVEEPFIIVDLVQIAEKGFVICGFIIEDGKRILSLAQIWNGKLDWMKNYPSDAFPGSETWPSAITKTQDGGLAIIGTIRGSLESFAWIIKTDEGGNIQWDLPYGSSGKYSRGTDIIQSNDQSLVSIGYTYPIYTDGSWIIKINNDGILETEEMYPEPVGSFRRIIQNSNGGYSIAGSTFDPNAWFTDFEHMMLFETDDNGVLMWNSTYVTTKVCEASDVIQLSDGGLVLLGFCLGNELYLVKTDRYGKEQWSRSLQQDYSFNDDKTLTYAAIVQPTEGTFTVAGIQSKEYYENDLERNTYAYTLQLVLTDQNGNHQWNQSYSATPYYVDTLVEEINLKSSDYNIIGFIQTDNGYVLSSCSCMSRLNTDGQVIWNKCFTEEKSMLFPINLIGLIAVISVTSLSILGIYTKKQYFVNRFLSRNPPDALLNYPMNEIISPLFRSEPTMIYFFMASSFEKQFDQDLRSGIPQEIYQFKFLLNPIRLSMIKLLYERIELSTSELRTSLGITRGEFNTHYDALRKKGYIRVEKKFVDDGSLKTVASLEIDCIKKYEELRDILLAFFTNTPNLNKYLKYVEETYDELYPSDQ
jgi:DNA-binding transcriptional ArsR family regulator